VYVPGGYALEYMVDLPGCSDELLAAFESMLNSSEPSRLGTILHQAHAISVDISAVAQAILDVVHSVELSEWFFLR
jgi:hypothetical protein